MKTLRLSSEEARLADRRVRVVRDEPADRPDRHFDLVFAEAKDGKPAGGVLREWEIDLGSGPVRFYTTEERCRKMVSQDPADWTQEKLASFEEEEKRLWRDWLAGDVFGWILEKWDPARREFVHEDSCYGYFGAEEILRAVAEDAPEGLPVCAEDGLADSLSAAAV